MKRRSLKLKIASPCNADWNKMSGDEAIRFCGECNKNVYHLSYMSNEQVEQLLSRAEDTPCVRFYERKDGSVLLGDCPVGGKKARRRRTAVAVGAAMLSAVGLAMYPGGSAPGPNDVDIDTEPDAHEVRMGGMMPEPPPEPDPPATMGEIDMTARPAMGKPISRPPKADVSKDQVRPRTPATDNTK